MIRSLARVVLAGLLIVIIVIAAGIPVFFHPFVADSPREVDVILVLGGRHDGREEQAISLAQRGFADTVLIANPYYSGDNYMRKMCASSTSTITVVCFKPMPETTRGEARYLKLQAAKHNWNSAIVLTFAPQLTRARYIVGRCFPGTLVMVANEAAIPIGDWAWNYGYQSFGLLKAALEDGC